MATGRQIRPGRTGQPPGPLHVDCPQFIKLLLFAIRKQQRGSMQNPRAVDHGVDGTPVTNGAVNPGFNTGWIVGVVGVMQHRLNVQVCSP